MTLKQKLLILHFPRQMCKITSIHLLLIKTQISFKCGFPFRNIDTKIIINIPLRNSGLHTNLNNCIKCIAFFYDFFSLSKQKQNLTIIDVWFPPFYFHKYLYIIAFPCKQDFSCPKGGKTICVLIFILLVLFSFSTFVYKRKD